VRAWTAAQNSAFKDSHQLGPCPNRRSPARATPTGHGERGLGKLGAAAKPFQCDRIAFRAGLTVTSDRASDCCRQIARGRLGTFRALDELECARHKDGLPFHQIAAGFAGVRACLTIRVAGHDYLVNGPAMIAPSRPVFGSQNRTHLQFLPSSLILRRRKANWKVDQHEAASRTRRARWIPALRWG